MSQPGMCSRDPLTAPPSPRNIATIAVFYALPVIQLVITYQTVSVAWGAPGSSGGQAVLPSLQGTSLAAPCVPHAARARRW